MIDAAIPLQSQTFNLGNTLSQLGNIQAQQQTQQLRGQQIQEGNISLAQNQQNAQDESDVRAAMAAGTQVDPATGQPTLDRGAMLSTLARLNPTKAAQTSTALATQDTATAEAQQRLQQAKLQTATETNATMGQILGNIVDQPSYTNALQHAKSLGIDTSQYPLQYDPKVVAQAQQQALTVQQQLAQKNAEATQAEAARKDTATEANTAATLANTQAYQKSGLGLRSQQVGIAGGELGLKREQAGVGTNGQPSDLATAIAQGHIVPDRLGYLLSRNPTLIQGVMAADPTFDSSKAASYANTYKDFTSGKTSVALNAGGTALQHLQELQGMNTAESHIPGTADYNAYQNKADTVSAELARFYGTDTVPGIASIKSTLTSQLPGTRQAALTTQAKSMGDKLDSYQQTWQNAAPSAAYQAPMPGISPKAIAARAALDPDYKPSAPAAQSPQSSGLGVKLSDAMALPQNKGKSAAEVTQDIQAHGHTVIQ